MTLHDHVPSRVTPQPWRNSGPASALILQRKCACASSSGKEGEDKAGSEKKPDTNREFYARWHSDFASLSLRSSAEINPQASPGQGFPLHSPEARQLHARSEQVKKKAFFCPPVADTLTHISAMTGGGGTIGITKFDPSSQLICAPRKFDIDQKTGTCSFKPVSVSLSLISKFVAPSATPLPTSDAMEVPACGQKQVPIFGQVTQAISDLAKAGEQEHCDDLSISFARTLTPCTTEVNKFAGQKLTGKNEDECFKSLVAKLGFDPISCSDEFNDLTKKDDERDVKGFHDFDPVLISSNCNQVVTGYKPSKTNKINDPAVAPNKFIPASTRCAKPSTTNPTPTAPVQSRSGLGSSGQGSGTRPPAQKDEKTK